MVWNLHIASAQSQLHVFQDEITQSIRNAETKVAEALGTFDLDVVVQEIPNQVIPEVGFVGYAPTAGLVHLTFDFSNPRCKSSLGKPLERMMVHEANHAFRWQGPGYGRHLGGALVSEGLAGQFTRQLYGNPPEPWELPEEGDKTFLPEVILNWDSGYDHGKWFFGNATHPRWLGYRLGYWMVGEHVALTGQTAADLTQVPANEFLATAEKIAV